jgi:hypothetical protein
LRNTSSSLKRSKFLHIYHIKTLLILSSILLLNTLSAQTIYKNNKFFGGSFYINSDALKDITINGKSTDNNGDEYWNNSPFDDEQSKDIDIRAKMRSSVIYGYFPANNLAIGGNLNISSNSFNNGGGTKSFGSNENQDTLYLLKNKSFDVAIGPFIRYYIEIGAQPYEIGAIFIEGAYHIGVGMSEDNLRFKISDSTSWTQSASYDYHMHIMKAKVGFSWYLSDFLSHNWFTGAELSLEPSVSYNWTIKNEHFEDLVRKYRGIRFNLALIAYF